jgi:hypothetical protein
MKQLTAQNLVDQIALLKVGQTYDYVVVFRSSGLSI